MTTQHGIGGSYRIDEGGNRVLIHRTEDGQPAKEQQTEPAKAGFFTPKEIQKPAAPDTDAELSTNKE